MSFRAVAGLSALLAACGTYQGPAEPEWPHPDESEFLVYCDPPGDGQWAVQSPENPECDDPFHVTWESLPLKVYSEAEYLDEVVLAVDAWNYWLGMDVFVVTSSESSADVLVFSAESEWFIAKAIQGSWDGRHLAGVAVAMPDYFTGPVAAHELGHVLGLSHDHDSQWSIMSYKNWTWLEDVDRRALLRKYGE